MYTTLAPESLENNRFARTVKQAVNHYLTFQIRRAESNEIGYQWVETCRSVLENFAQLGGWGGSYPTPSPMISQQYRQSLAKKELAGRGGWVSTLLTFSLHRATLSRDYHSWIRHRRGSGRMR